ncbi:MAG: helix-turn-helix domain-containing protein [Paracoccaceae bacterium]|nr:helix-turn-helix domain-containing protein [Paracoccaceae bacterium]
MKIVSALARLMPDGSIAALLNHLGRRTTKGNNWNAANVRSFRSYRKIPVYRDGERQERNEVTLAETAERLGVGESSVHRLIKKKMLPARQVCKGAPWVISGAELERVAVRKRSRLGQPSLFARLEPGNDPSSPGPEKKVSH